MEASNKFNHVDRNGLMLNYNDTVYIKSCWKEMYTHRIVGFTKYYIVCVCGSYVRYRKPSNVVKITNAETWKYYE
jgi:hypothetical protein